MTAFPKLPDCIQTAKDEMRIFSPQRVEELLRSYRAAVWRAAIEQAASEMEAKTLRRRMIRAAISATELEPCEFAAAIRALALPQGEEGESNDG